MIIQARLIGFMFIFAFCFSAKSQELRKLGEWDFPSDANYIKQKLASTVPQQGFSYQLENGLAIQRNKNTKPTSLIGRTQKITLPRFFLLQATLKKLNTSIKSIYTVMLRGESADGRICEWRLPLRPVSSGKAGVYKIQCQAPQQVDKIRFYLNFGLGEIQIESIEIFSVSNSVNDKINYFSDEQLLVDPEFKSAIPAQPGEGWTASSRNIVKASEAHEIHIEDGYLRQLKIPIHFPGRYILAFEAKFQDKLTLSFRGKGVLTKQFLCEQDHWKYYQMTYPALQANCSTVYLNIKGKNFSLRNISLIQLPEDITNTQKKNTEIEKELDALFTAHPKLLNKEIASVKHLTTLSQKYKMHPYMYYIHLDRIAKKAKLKVIVF